VDKLLGTFFKNDFTNVFDAPKNPIMPEKILAAKFSSITNWGTSLGLEDLASYNQTGKKSQPAKFPFRLVFKPNPELRNKYSDNYQTFFLDQLKEIKEGTVLYDVYAVENPGCEEKKIGELTMTSKFTSSHFADEKLFFQHHAVDAEDKTRNWAEYRDYYSVWTGLTEAKKAKKGDFGCPFSSLFQ